MHTLEALDEAVEMGFVKPILTGNEERIKGKLHSLNIDSTKYEIIHADSSRAATETAVKLVHNGKADLIMKGMISTDQFMKVLLKKEYGLLPSRATLSHISVMDSKHYHKLLIFSDAAVIPYPDLKQKILMTELKK